jgi:hypothetical protein
VGVRLSSDSAFAQKDEKVEVTFADMSKFHKKPFRQFSETDVDCDFFWDSVFESPTKLAVMAVLAVHLAITLRLFTETEDAAYINVRAVRAGRSDFSLVSKIVNVETDNWPLGSDPFALCGNSFASTTGDLPRRREKRSSLAWIKRECTNRTFSM